MSQKNIPTQIQQYFNTDNIRFEVSKFEQYLLNDIYSYDEKSKQKLSRNLTKDFHEEINTFLRQKRNIRYSIKGETRDGKSLVGLKIMNIVFKHNNIDFNANCAYYVCGNQIEYRQKLLNAEFGDFYLVDENFFTRAGLGANIETSQLNDYNNIIAKKNIGSAFITPKRFLNVGSVLGFASYGRDTKNWLSRFLIFKFKDDYPHLVGYVVFDIGEMFRENGCYVYKFTGGCNNTEKLKINDIPKEIIKHSWAIPKDYDKEKVVNDKSVCPFYNVCTHGLCMYEHKKDTWIDKEMTGKMDDRTQERYKLAINVLHEMFAEISETGSDYKIKLLANNQKDLKNKVKVKIHKYSNVKMGIAEFDELIEMIKSLTSVSFLCETLKTINDEKLSDKIFSIENGGYIINQVYSSLVSGNEQ